MKARINSIEGLRGQDVVLGQEDLQPGYIGLEDHKG
jgi:hypothetical protein